MYLRSYVTFQGKALTQREGICICAGAAPLLCDLFLSKVDREASVSPEGADITCIFCYVDDFLVLYDVIKRTQPNW